VRVDREKFLLAATATAAMCCIPSNSRTSAGPTEGRVRTQTPTLAPSDNDSPLSGGDGSGACRAKSVARPSVCDDGDGKPVDCGKADCRELYFICEHCEAYKRYFKPRIAERAVACVVAQSGPQLSDGCRTYQCGDEALKGACLDPGAAASCWPIAKSCNTSVDECTGLLSGMNDDGRRKVLACAQSGCPFGLWSCVEGI
jgi:hypothetical protein